MSEETVDKNKIQVLRSILKEPTSIFWTDLELQKIIDYFGDEFMRNVCNKKLMQDSRIASLTSRVKELEERVNYIDDLWRHVAMEQFNEELSKR